MENNNSGVYRTWEDGYVVRAMSQADADKAMQWYCGICPTACDLQVALQVFPTDGRGFYSGEYQGEMVASAIRIPWAENVYYGSYYYVEEKYRRRGFGTRLRDDVAADHVGDSILAIDAHDDLQKMNEKRGYVVSFSLSRFDGLAPDMCKTQPKSSSKLQTVDDLNFDQVLVYDNKCFVRPDSQVRRAFLRKWIDIEGSVSYCAVNESGHVVGYGCRRPAFQKEHHLIGPLYADSYDVAYDIAKLLCSDVRGKYIAIDICLPNIDAVKLADNLGLKEGLKMIRMHLNGDLKEYKPQVFGVTSIDVCGF